MEIVPDAESDAEAFRSNLIQVIYTGDNGEVATEEVHGFGGQISDDVEEVEEYTPINGETSPGLPRNIRNVSTGDMSNGADNGSNCKSDSQPCSLKIVKLIKDKDSLILIPSNDEFLKPLESDNGSTSGGQNPVELESESEKYISSTSACSPRDQDLPPILTAYRNFPDDLCDSSYSYSEEINPETMPNQYNEVADFNKESPPILSPEISVNLEEPDTTISQIPAPDQEKLHHDDDQTKDKKKIRQAKETSCSFSVTPHSSAEIQERVKNRQRKKTLSFNSGSPEVSEECVKKPKIEASLVLDKKKVSSKKPKREAEIPTASNSYLEGLFIVERIVKKSFINDKLYFYVKWLNYPSSKNTWEPSENFSPELIQYYENTLEITPAAEVLRNKQFQLSHGIKSSTSKKIRKKKKSQGPVSNSTLLASDCLETPKESESTFEDMRMKPTGFDKGYKFNKVMDSFILDGVKCGLVQFVGLHKLELIPFFIINEKVRSVLIT